MKNKTKELDLDFIGGYGSLTKDEEKQISDFLNAQKLLIGKYKKLQKSPKKRLFPKSF